MAYSKVSNKTQDKDVKYLNKDYNSFKSRLIDFAKIYFPNNWNAFSEGNPGMMFLEMAAYVGDVLSFYTDTQLRENFLLLAQDYENLYNLSYAMGYNPKVTEAANVDLDVFQLVPSINIGGKYEPDYDYSLTINRGTTVSSTEGVSFYLPESVRFSNSSSFSPTNVSVYQYNSSNIPEYYLLKKQTQAISAQQISSTFNVGAPQKFLTLNLLNTNIISIESITDSDGNEWHEVPYLAQDTIFEEIENTAANDPELHGYNHQTPYLLKLKKVPKRFTSRFKSTGELEIQFGSGTTDNSDASIIPDPNNIGLGIKDGRSKLDKAYDPSNFLYTKAYGEVPSSTTLTVKYLIGGGTISNVNADTITKIDTLKITPKKNKDTGLGNFIRGSVAFNNPEAARGGGTGDSVE